MGQKTNPTILQIGKKLNWDSQYFEKKTTETAQYAFKDLEIKNFMHKFFKDNGLIIHNCKLHYIDETSLHIFISYFLTKKSVSIITTLNKQQNIKLVKLKKYNKYKSRYLKIKKNVKNSIKYRKISYNKILNTNIKKHNYKKIKKKFQTEKNYLKPRRNNNLKHYKRYITIKNLKKIKSIDNNKYLEKFFESIKLFFDKKINIFLTFKQLNKNLKQTLNLEKTKLLKKHLIHLKKYKNNNFFNEGINTLFICMTYYKSSQLLTNFIATQLSKLKRHNFFFKFIKTTLTIFKNNKFSNIKGIKIKIKGRFNGAPRAKHKTVIIGDGVANLSLNSIIDYSEKTAYTSNGTFGIKTWISSNNINKNYVKSTKTN